MIDYTIAQYSEGLPLMISILEDTKEQHDDYHEIDRTVVSVCLFVVITMIDSMVAGKYFIHADRDYDWRFMRGKLFVTLNEGFKKLYGFNEKSHKKSEWDKLQSIMKYFPEVINRQYQELTYLIKKNPTPLPDGKTNATMRPILTQGNYINHGKKRLLKAK